MKLFQVSGLLSVVNDGARQYVGHDEFILAPDETTACRKFEEVHPTAMKIEEGFTKCTFICMRDSIIPTTEPLQEICKGCREFMKDCECEGEEIITFTPWDEEE